MENRIAICLVSILLAGTAPSLAQTAALAKDKITAESLLAQDYAIAAASVIPSGGAALFLRKGAKVYFCFISETRESATVSTEYCKPVE